MSGQRFPSNRPAVCPSCDSELLPEAVYCPSCGRKAVVPSSASRYSLREKVALSLFGLLVMSYYLMLVLAVENRMKVESPEISGAIFATGLLASGLARKRRILFFFLGCLLAVPLIFLAAILGGALRAL